MSNIILPKWTAEQPVGFECCLTPKVWHRLYSDLNWSLAKWTLNTKESPMFGTGPHEWLTAALIESAIRVCVDNGYGQEYSSRNNVAKDTGLPVLDEVTYTGEEIGTSIALHVIDAIHKGDVTVEVNYKYRIGNIVFLPTFKLVRVNYPLRQEQNIHRACRLTKLYHAVADDVPTKMKLKSLIKEHGKYHYGPRDLSCIGSRRYIPYKAMKFVEQ